MRSSMSIVYKNLFFQDGDSLLHWEKDRGGEKYFSCYLYFETQEFLSYQKDIFEDFLGDVMEIMSCDEYSWDTTKEKFEKLLQGLNAKLAVFAEKIEKDIVFNIHGVVQIFFGLEYLASFIGNAGIIVMRNGSLQYMMNNTAGTHKKIQIFSEIIEGELQDGDKMYIAGLALDQYIDSYDVKNIARLSQQSDKEFTEILLDVLEPRVQREEIAFLTEISVSSSIFFPRENKKKDIFTFLLYVRNFFYKLGLNKNYVIYTLVGVFFLILLYGLVQSFLISNEARFVEVKNGVVVDFTLEDIKKDIALFKRIDPSSDEKIKKYQEIVAQLNLLTERKRWVNDVAELRRILEAEYYQGFNIVLVNNNSFFANPLYVFTQQEKNIFGNVQNVFYKDGLMIGGREGILLGAINDRMRGTLVSASTDMKFRSCTMNLLNNGLYCFTEDNILYNIIKGGQVNPLTNESGEFPNNIVDIDTFGNSNFYVLTDDKDLNSAGTYIVRYTNLIGSQEKFGEGTEYLLQDVASGSNDGNFAASGFSSFTIDGSFLVWSKSEKSLYQLWRSDASPNLQYRKVPLVGGDTLEGYSENTKLIAFPTSRFVYFFDKDNQTFTVYKSSPYKTNDAHTYKYTLQYFFRIKFAVEDKYIIDVFVDEGERAMLYLLTHDGVYTFKLYDYRNTFFEKEMEDNTLSL